MSEPKWTPGPWELCRLPDGTIAVKKAGETWGNGGIAIVLSDNREADGHLISAVHDLREACEAACEELMRQDEIDKRVPPETFELLETALRKARGETT